jgi:hypothetical protein
MTPAEAKAFMVDLLRTAARLVEDGTITEWSIDSAFGHALRPDPATHGYTLHHVSTGQKTITVTLEAGHLSSDRIPKWLGGDAPQLPDAAGDAPHG